MAFNRVLGPVALVLALVSTTTLGHAEITAHDRESARNLMDEGKRLLAANDPVGALTAFRAADAIMHVPTTGIAVARAQASLGLLVDARDTAMLVRRIPVAPAEPPAFAEARAAADVIAEELAPRIPTLRIELTGLTDGHPAVTVDGVAISIDKLTERKVDPGHHVVVAKLGEVERNEEIDIIEREAKSIAFDFTGVIAPPPPVGEGGKEVTPVGLGGGTLAMYGGFGLAAGGLVVGSLAGVLALGKKSSASKGCRDQQCPPSTYADIDAAYTMATVATVGFVAAGVGAAVGAGFLVFGSPQKKTSPAAPAPNVTATAWFGPGSAGIRGQF